MKPVLVVLGRGEVPYDTPVLHANDLGVVRGDGVFETLNVRGGRPWLLDEHLARMARSAQRLELPLPSRDELVQLAEQACASWPADVEGALRLVCTRGRETGGPVTCYATLNPISPQILRMRREGIRILTASLGFAAEARKAAPWLLGGAKSLSYAVNMASQRWAANQGYDDVLWVSADGYALEGPTSTLVWLSGDELCTVPTDTGILAGTTARFLLDHAAERGWRAAERMVRPAELETTDGAWLVSSARGIAAIREIDGRKLPESPHDAALRSLAGFPN